VREDEKLTVFFELERIARELALSALLGDDARQGAWQPPHRRGLNAVLLHRGHLPAVSNETGLVKCFTYRHSLHSHRIERFSCD
jgi:hypothetical protein